MIPTHGQARQKAEEIKEFLEAKVCGTFPRGVANRFAERFGAEGAAFIADIDAFHKTLAGYGRLGGKWLQADVATMAEVRNAAGRPFFSRYPQHRELQSEMGAFPDLEELMSLYEVVRKRLVALMTTIEQVRNR